MPSDAIPNEPQIDTEEMIRNITEWVEIESPTKRWRSGQPHGGPRRRRLRGGRPRHRAHTPAKDGLGRPGRRARATAQAPESRAFSCFAIWTRSIPIGTKDDHNPVRRDG